MKRLFQKVLAAFKNPKKLIKLIYKQFYVLLRFGPAAYWEYLQRAFGRHMFIHNFPNGIKTSLDVKKARNWYLLNKKPLVIVLFGTPSKDISKWAERLIKETHSCLLISPQLQDFLHDLDKKSYVTSESMTSLQESDLVSVKRDIHQHYRGNDAIFLDLSQPLVSGLDIIRLQHAAYSYDEDREIGFVLPSYAVGEQIIAGYEFDRRKEIWSPVSRTETDYNQWEIPRYTLAGAAHGLYMTQHTIQRLSVTRHELPAGDLDAQVSYFIAQGWKQNIRTLTFSPVQFSVDALKVPQVANYHKDWFSSRRTTNTAGDKKVIYVLNATSVSGGIRVIFEHANGLVKRGFDVEIWSLQGQPTWTDLNITVKKFRTYSDLLLALRNEDAVKVATWWETAQIVWLASVNNGIPVNFIQEFETWFYPDDEIARAAVVSSYRKEFAYMTTADYQRDELREIGINAPIIPVGYEQEYYHQDVTVERKTDVVLALGRSFFQKNFAMTARAWQSLGDARPQLHLFGSEPDVLTDERVTYHKRPSNAEVNTLYNQATCFVQTSRHEGFSLPIIEAMAAGCPVITTDSHGNRGFCHDGKNCLIIGQDDDKALSDAIARLVNDTALQEKFRQAGIQTAKEYEWTRILDELADFYTKL